MLRLPSHVHAQIVGHCLDGLPYEACGLLSGRPEEGVVVSCYLTRNVAESARYYTVDPAQHLRADRDAESEGLVIMGAFHSHTHSPAYPSPTDVEQAPDPSWHYVVVSLGAEAPVVRSFRIEDGRVIEEPIVLERR